MNGAPTIVMTVDAVGGVWTYALTLCAGLPQYRFVLAMMGPSPRTAQREAALALGNVALEEGGYRLEWMQGAEADLAASRRWLAGLARRHGAALVHCNGYAQAAIDTEPPVIAVAHSDVLSWWAAVHGDEAPQSWNSYRHEAIAGLAAADRVVAPSRAVLDDLARHYGFSGRHARVIPNGIDPGAFSPRPKRPVVMAAGRLWDEAKNLTLLDHIAGDLEWPVEIAGDSANPEGGSVRFGAAHLLGILGRTELAERLSTAAVFAAPARYEPFGLGVLEAAASGCALALSDIRSLRENWHGAAVFVPPDDENAWRAALAELIANGERRRRLAKAAQQRAADFGREAMAGRYGGLYRELIDAAERREVA